MAPSKHTQSINKNLMPRSIWETIFLDEDVIIPAVYTVCVASWHHQFSSQDPRGVSHILSELGTRQFYSFATTTTRQPNRASDTRKNTTNFKVSSNWSNQNKYRHNAISSIKTWSRCRGSVVARAQLCVFSIINGYFCGRGHADRVPLGG